MFLEATSPMRTARRMVRDTVYYYCSSVMHAHTYHDAQQSQTNTMQAEWSIGGFRSAIHSVVHALNPVRSA